MFLISLQGHVEDVRRQVNEAVQSRHVSVSSFELYNSNNLYNFNAPMILIMLEIDAILKSLLILNVYLDYRKLTRCIVFLLDSH